MEKIKEQKQGKVLEDLKVDFVDPDSKETLRFCPSGSVYDVHSGKRAALALGEAWWNSSPSVLDLVTITLANRSSSYF